MPIGKTCSRGPVGRAVFITITCNHVTALWGRCCFFQKRTWVTERPAQGHVAQGRCSWIQTQASRPGSSGPLSHRGACEHAQHGKCRDGSGGPGVIHTGSVQKVPATRSEVQLHPWLGLRLSILSRRQAVGAASRSPLLDFCPPALLVCPSDRTLGRPLPCPRPEGRTGQGGPLSYPIVTLVNAQWQPSTFPHSPLPP